MFGEVNATGDRQNGLMELYRKHQRVILAQLRGRVPLQDVEDVVCAVVDAMLARYEHLQEWPEKRQAMYIRSMARNEAVNYLRRRIRTRRHVLDIPDEDMANVPDGADSPEAQAIRRSEMTAMQAAIRALPPEKRDLLEMKYLQDMDDAQIAARMGISRENVRQRLSRLRKELRKRMEDMGYER